MVSCLPQRQQNGVLVSQSQPCSLVCTVSDSSVTTLSVVEFLTTSSSEVTSIIGQHVSTITTAGVYILSYCVATYKYIAIQ